MDVLKHASVQYKTFIDKLQHFLQHKKVILTGLFNTSKKPLISNTNVFTQFIILYTTNLM